MAEARVFGVPDGFDVEELVHDLTVWLRDAKNLDTELVAVEGGYLIQARRAGDLKKWIGMDDALQVRFFQRIDQLVVHAGSAKWIDRFSEGFPGNIILSPLSVTAALGSWFRKSLPEEAVEWVEEYISRKMSGTGKSPPGAEKTEARGAPQQREHLQLNLFGRYFKKLSAIERDFLRAHLRAGEIPLAWLGASSVSAPGAGELPAARTAWSYLLTSERSNLVGFARTSDTLGYELPAKALFVTSAFGRDSIAVNGFMWKTEFTNDFLYSEIASVPALDEVGRLREMARLNWVKGQKNKGATVSQWLLEILSLRTDDPLDCLSHAYVRHVTRSGSPGAEALDSVAARAEMVPCLQRLLQAPGASDRLNKWAQDWQLPASHEMSLVQMILGLEPTLDAAEMALPLHRQAMAAVMAKERDPLRLAVLDIAFARHLLQAGHHAEAVEVLDDRLAHLPDESLLDLLPPKELDLTRSGAQMMRIGILELLAEARGDPDVPHMDTIGELARLQPLVVKYLDDLIRFSTGSLHRRAEEVRRLFDLNGLRPAENHGFERIGQVRPLPKDLLESRLPHPTATSEGMVEWLESWLGQSKVPDYSALKAYVERVTAKAHPQLMDAISNAATALGIKKIEAYISRGDKEVGVRAYEGSPPFLLIGAAHLNPDSDLHMRIPELSFIVAAELAHLRFAHTRLTSSELWDGVFRKGTQILGVFGALSGPIGFIGGALKSLHNLSRSEQVLRRAEVLTGGAKKAVDYVGMAKNVQRVASSVGKQEDEHERGALTENEEKALAAYRLMQLTADRAGLVLCGDIRAAVRAVFLSSSQYYAALPSAVQHGLAAALEHYDGEGRWGSQDLAVRLAALCSFYLSDDYELLRHALSGE